MDDHALDLDAMPSPTSAERRVLAISADGGVAVTTDADTVRIAGGAPLLAAAGAVAAACLDGAIWIVTRAAGACTLHRFHLDGARIGSPVPLGDLGDDVVMAATRTGARVALIEGTRAAEVRERGGAVVVDALGERARDRRVLLASRGVVERRGPALVFRRPGPLTDLVLPADVTAATVVAGSVVLDGAAAAIEIDLRGQRQLLLLELRRGTFRTRIRLGDAVVKAVAERRGLVVLGRGAHLALLDLRAGACIAERIFPAPIDHVAVDADGDRFVILDERGGTVELSASLTEAAAEMADREAAPGPELDAPAIEESGALEAPAPVSAADPEATIVSAEIDPAPAHRASLDEAVLAGLGRRPSAGLSPSALRDYLDDTFALIAAYCRTAIATAWDTGRLAPSDPSRPPFATEVAALCDGMAGRAIAPLAEARRREQEAIERFARWNIAAAPHIQLARDLDLSPVASNVLLLAAAPLVWGELARTYALVANDRGRPLVDELLIAQLFEADAATRAIIARELDDGAPLRRSGAIQLGEGARPFACLVVHPVIARRLAGERFDGTSALVRDATCSLGALVAPDPELGDLVGRFAAPADRPARIVLRGSTGSGRRTVAAALAARAGRRLGLVELSGPPDSLAERLRAAIHDIALRGWIPCVTLESTGLEPGVVDRLRAVLDAHPGPLFLRLARDAAPPLTGHHDELDLTPLRETERRTAWRQVLTACDLPVAPADRLATRYRIGPGAIARAAASVRADDPRLARGDAEAVLTAALRQQRGSRIAAIASRVECLPCWHDLVLPDDVVDSLRELMARIRHRRTVLEDWGMGRVVSSARGVTALFQGGPGTGKTMAAGVLARELGYELWRVDLSRVMSKWLGETEKNLAVVFDAAEDGDVILLFDEADSLFGKRTEVKSSHDRYANVEVNYLLQRLDSFEGVAILTTNFGTSIDPAFKRRLGLHLQFPFPDQDERERLWRAHLPPTVPTAGPIDLAVLAARYHLSGGYIRNAVLRACYLAAADGTALTEEHLQRAVRALYRDMARVSDQGPLQ